LLLERVYRYLFRKEDVMAGGDARVWNTSIGSIGMINQCEVIDANTKQAGDFQFPRPVRGREDPLFFTKEGAIAFDALRAKVDIGATIKWEKDPGWLKRLFFGDSLAGKEQYLGNPKA
jgi:hypothetical protein